MDLGHNKWHFIGLSARTSLPDPRSIKVITNDNSFFLFNQISVYKKEMGVFPRFSSRALNNFL